MISVAFSFFLVFWGRGWDAKRVLYETKKGKKRKIVGQNESIGFLVKESALLAKSYANKSRLIKGILLPGFLMKTLMIYGGMVCSNFQVFCFFFCWNVCEISFLRYFFLVWRKKAQQKTYNLIWKITNTLSILAQIFLFGS